MSAMKQINKSSRKDSPDKNESSDIIQLILNHHRPLKSLIKTMKSKTATYANKKQAFAEFAPALVAHAKPEEQSWYKFMKARKDSRVEGLEGDVEHGLADHLCEELKTTEDKSLFMAKVKVLAELVEHHIEEEEREMLPHFKRETKQDVRIALGEEYKKIRKGLLDADKDDARPTRLQSIVPSQVHLN